MRRVALCFPGQGSQRAGMAQGLLDAPRAAELVDAAAAESLDLAAVLRGDDDALRATENAQPALLFVELMLARALPDTLDVVGVAGHSVGEYSALVVAGALDAADAMRLVVARGRAMAAMGQGTMVALLGADEALAERICSEVRAQGGGVVVIANLNAPGQVVLSGDEPAVAAAAAAARSHGVRRVSPLNVSGAFHSPLMAGAAAAVARRLEKVALRPARVPVACDVDGALVGDAEGLRARLARQLTEPVRWTACVASLVSLGVDALVEVGPGGVLSALARRIVPDVAAVSVSSSLEAAALPERLPASAARG